MNRFYHSKTINIGEIIVLDNFAAHHALKVMRMKEGDELILFDGNGSDFQGKVVNVTKKKVKVIINFKRNIKNESDLKVTLLQALTSNDKMDLIIQKTTKLLIRNIQPIVF